MTTRSAARFTIDVDGVARRVLSLAKSDNGDVRLVLKAAQTFRQDDFGEFDVGNPDYHKVRIAEQRYSLHMSTRSKANANTIKHTLRLENSKPLSGVQYTRAFKTSGRVAWIFSRRFPTLGADGDGRYIAKVDGAENVSLGSYNPDRFLLYVSFFAGPREEVFLTGDAKDFSVRHISIGTFNIYAFWSFINFRSLNTGWLQHCVTPKDGRPDTLPPEAEGLDHLTAIALFRTTRHEAFNQLFRELEKDRTASAETAKTLASALGFFRSGAGDATSPEWLEYKFLLQSLAGKRFIFNSSPIEFEQPDDQISGS